MEFNEKIVEFSCINIKDSAYRITTEKCVTDLIRSIKITGLINLPILVENNSGFSVVSGFRRIEACRRSGWLSVKSRVLEQDTDLQALIYIAITENAMARELNIIEISRCLNMLSEFYKDNELGEVASKLGLPENPAYIKKVKRLCSFSEPLQEGILSNCISVRIALELADLPYGAGDIFAVLFNRLKPGLNKQKEILTFAKEISLRDNICLRDLIEKERPHDILMSDEFDNRRKIELIRNYLKKRRFPVLSDAENRFKNLVKKLEFGAGMQLVPPADFEGRNYRLNLCFKNLEELESLKARLESIMINPGLKSILN